MYQQLAAGHFTRLLISYLQRPCPKYRPAATHHFKDQDVLFYNNDKWRLIRPGYFNMSLKIALYSRYNYRVYLVLSDAAIRNISAVSGFPSQHTWLAPIVARSVGRSVRISPLFLFLEEYCSWPGEFGQPIITVDLGLIRKEYRS